LKVQVSNPEEAAQPPIPNTPSEDVAMEDARQCESPEITKEKDDDEKDLGEVEDGESEEAVPASPTFEGLDPEDDDGEEIWEPNRNTNVVHDGTNGEHDEESCTDDDDD